MKLTKAETMALYEKIVPHLEAIEKLFKSPKVTLVVRADALPDGDIVLTQDDPEAIVASVQKLMARKPVIAPTDVINIRHVI